MKNCGSFGCNTPLPRAPVPTPNPPSMEAKLVIVGGKANKRDVRLKLPTVIGRSREADLTVAHPMISRLHCQLTEVDGRLELKDLGSLNGTLVGGERIDGEVVLRPDDEFTVGPLTFRVEYEYAGEQPEAPPSVDAEQETPDFGAVAVVDEEAAEMPPVEFLEDLPAASTAPAAAASETPDEEPWDLRKTEAEEKARTGGGGRPVGVDMSEARAEEPLDIEEVEPESLEEPEAQAAPDAFAEEEFGFELAEELAAGAAGNGQDESPWSEPLATAVEPAEAPTPVESKEPVKTKAPARAGTPSGSPPSPKQKDLAPVAPQNGQSGKASAEQPEPEDEEITSDLNEAEDAALRDFLKGLQ